MNSKKIKTVQKQHNFEYDINDPIHDSICETWVCSKCCITVLCFYNEVSKHQIKISNSCVGNKSHITVQNNN